MIPEDLDRLVLVFDTEPKQDYTEVLKKFPYNIEMYIDKVAKKHYRYKNTIKIISPTELNSLSDTLGTYHAHTIILLNGAEKYFA